MLLLPELFLLSTFGAKAIGTTENTDSDDEGSEAAYPVTMPLVADSIHDEACFSETDLVLYGLLYGQPNAGKCLVSCS